MSTRPNSYLEGRKEQSGAVSNVCCGRGSGTLANDSGVPCVVDVEDSKVDSPRYVEWDDSAITAKGFDNSAIDIGSGVAVEQLGDVAIAAVARQHCACCVCDLVPQLLEGCRITACAVGGRVGSHNHERLACHDCITVVWQHIGRCTVAVRREVQRTCGARQAGSGKDCRCQHQQQWAQALVMHCVQGGGRGGGGGHPMRWNGTTSLTVSSCRSVTGAACHWGILPFRHASHQDGDLHK